MQFLAFTLVKIRIVQFQKTGKNFFDKFPRYWRTPCYLVGECIIQKRWQCTIFQYYLDPLCSIIVIYLQSRWNHQCKTNPLMTYQFLQDHSCPRKRSLTLNRARSECSKILQKKNWVMSLGKSIVHSNLDIANKSIRPFLFTKSNNSIYQV